MNIPDNNEHTHDHSDYFAEDIDDVHEHSHSIAHIATICDLPDKKTLFEAGELMRALAAPVRISIVILLEQPRCVHEIVEALHITQPLVSQHLRVLRSAGVVSGERIGREVIYRLVDDHLVQIVRSAVEHVQE